MRSCASRVLTSCLKCCRIVVVFEERGVRVSLAERIKKIQNGAKSLMWGCSRHSETETLFVVGHKSYRGVVKYFIVSEDFMIREVEDRTQVLVKKCSSEDEVLSEVTKLLKGWFPAKGSE